MSLERAMGVDLLSRLDTKVAVPLRWLAPLLDRLAASRRDRYRIVATPTGVAPRYSTLYLDTADFADYRAHHNKRRIRQKYRYRIYHSTDSVFFEIKQRTSRRSSAKTRLQLAGRPTTIGAGERSLASELGLALGSRTPALRVDYRRITFVGPDQRVTIDLGLACRGRNRAVADFSRAAIVEIKDGHRQPQSPISQALRELGLRPHGISKYCIGIASCFDEVKRNRFEARLRQLGAW